MKKLADYRKKRDFARTAEPNGEETAKKDNSEKKTKTENIADGALKFAVQHHIARREHYDFRLEWGGVLLSWAVPKGPSYNPQDKRLAVKVEDHPLEYADFEGVIPKGQYGGGTVMLWDEGAYLPLADFDNGLKEGSLKFVLCGKRLQGAWTLVRMKTEEGAENWLLIKEKDELAKNDNGIDGFGISVRTGKTHEQIANQTLAEKGVEKSEKTKKISEKSKKNVIYEKNFAGKKNPEIKLEVELCKSVYSVPDGEDWLYEVKYDGYRIITVAENGKVKLLSRNGGDYTQKFSVVAEALKSVIGNRAVILDGEMIVPDKEGKSDFGALQSYVKNPSGALVYMAFDILALDGDDLTKLPLMERKKILAEFLSDMPDCVRESAYIVGQGRESAVAAAKAGLEGIVGKKVNSPYRGGRGNDWIKYKCYKRQEFVLGGFTRTDKSTGISALLLGVYEESRAEKLAASNKQSKRTKKRDAAKKTPLKYAGRAGTGLNRKSEAELLKLFSEYAADMPPFDVPPRASGGEEIFWLKPELVGEVQFAEWTKENRLRQASFKGLRNDKSAREVFADSFAVVPEDSVCPHSSASDAKPRELQNKNRGESKKREENGELTVCGIKISHPDKIVYPDIGVTKAEVVKYYEAAAERMLPYVGNRVLSVVRCHNGVGAACFFNKHPSAASKANPINVSDGKGGEHTYFYIDSPAGLIAEAQLGGLEFHVWGSRVQKMESPDTMIFDLDPDDGLPAERLKEGALELKKILDSLKLPSLLKTSGGKGYHIVVPFPKNTDWKQFREFAKQTAVLAQNSAPELFTSNLRKEKRKNKIFVDWGRNTRGATAVAPYSLRARGGAKVSMPIKWSELDSVSPDGIDIFEATERLQSENPWQ